MSAEEAVNMRNKVRALQITLFRAAKQSPDRRFGALYDKIYREDVLWESWERVRANDGAPGVDKQSFDEIENEIGVEVFLREIAEKLRAQRYRPFPVRRCWIEKPGKPEKRPLGIPVIRDRVIQMATKIVIEPIFEANFLPCSYGFRPKRSAHDAIRKIRSSITFKRRTIVIDADIKGYFDNIRHDILDDLIQRRISDPRVLKLLRGWLRAGVLDDGEWIEPGGLGTPQGGVMTPRTQKVTRHMRAFWWPCRCVGP
jgi:RNA-directed DNA polymerase